MLGPAWKTPTRSRRPLNVDQPPLNRLRSRKDVGHTGQRRLVDGPHGLRRRFMMLSRNESRCERGFGEVVEDPIVVEEDRQMALVVNGEARRLGADHDIGSTDVDLLTRLELREVGKELRGVGDDLGWRLLAERPPVGVPRIESEHVDAVPSVVQMAQ